MARAQQLVLPLELRTLLAGLTSAEVAEDQQWILELLRGQGAVVATMLWRMLGSEPDVLDAYQTAVCQLTARQRDGCGCNPAGYFYRTAMHAGIEILRRRRLRQAHWPAVVDSQTRRDAERTDTQDCAGALDQKHILEQMRRAITSLPPRLRDVIILHDLAELPYNQVSRLLGITNGTARIYRRQAVLQLAGLMGQEAMG